MQLRYLTTLEPAREQMAKVSSIAFAPNNLRLAVVTVDRIVRLYDETGEQRDKFSTKPADKANAKNYAVTAMEWSPDSTKLAIGACAWPPAPTAPPHSSAPPPLTRPAQPNPTTSSSSTSSGPSGRTRRASATSSCRRLP